MANLVMRLKKRLDITLENWYTDACFSKKLACYRVISDIGGRAGLKRISLWGKNKKEQWILEYLHRIINPVIEKYKQLNIQGTQDENAPIWICWWTGIENAPALVQQCIKSIYQSASNHSVNLITENNYSEYLSIPTYILEKYKNKKMGTAHFADYLRVSLLEQYGGLWLDATIFCSNRIPEEYFGLPFFTCKSEVKKGYYLSDFQWTTFCLGGWKHNIFYQFMKDAFELYWRDHDVAIDYLFFDDVIFLAKEYVPAIRCLMDAVPINNIHRDDLQAAMNASLPAEEFRNILQEDTVLYKLSWRETYCLKYKEKETVYNYLLNDV